MKAPTAVLLTVLLVLAPLAATVRAENDRSAEVLIENAKRLQLLVHYRNEVIAGSSLPSINATLWATIQNLTARADQYLRLAVEQFTAGNATLAKNYALTAMHLYSDVLELQSEVAEELGLEFRFEGALPLNLTASVSNMTVALNKTALILQMQVLEARIAQLREQLSRVNTSLFDIADAMELLNRASETLAKAKAALDAGNLTVSDLARMLAEVKRILGLVTAELNRASLRAAIAKAMKLGWLKKNETEYLENALINRTLTKRLEKTIRERAMNWSEIESIRNYTKQLVEKVFKEVKSRIEKAAERAGTPAKISVRVEVEREAPPATPPGWAKKAERGAETPAPPKQGKGARG